jgi:uncharacterized protein
VGVIYLDACVLIYAIENHPVRAPTIRTALAAARNERFAISPLVRLECLVKPMRDGDLLLQRRYETGLELLLLLQMPDPVFSLATQLRARFNLKTPDALHLACAQHHGCSALWTNDERLQRAGHGLARNVLAG